VPQEQQSNLGSKEGIFNAKMEIANYMKKDCLLIVNGDDEYLSKLMKTNTSYQKSFVGFGNGNNIYIDKIISEKTNEIIFTVNIENKLHTFTINVPGKHNIYNALLAIGVGIYFDIAIYDIVQAIAEYRGSNMRLGILNLNSDIKLINDCYNASPDSMRSALDVLNNIDSKRKIAILGDMFEMGSYSQKAHKEVGYMVAERNIDLLITIGIESRNIGLGAIENGFPSDKVMYTDNNTDVIEILDKILLTEDALLIKGSRGMKMEEIVHFLQERR